MNILIVCIPIIAFLLWKLHKQNQDIQECEMLLEQLKTKLQVLNNQFEDIIEKDNPYRT
jgi:uncharacterized protein YoxC